jgi:transposase
LDGAGPQRAGPAAADHHCPATATRTARRTQIDPRKAALCRKLRPALSDLDQPSQAAKLALRSLARRIDTLDAEIAELDEQLQPLVAQAAPRTTQLLGISTGHGGQLLTAGQNIERLHSEGAFAALCGTSPIPASSGRTTRHRLNYGGDRDANRTLHMIAVCRLRYCARTQAYAARRTKEQDHARDHPLPEALHRTRHLPRPAGRPRRAR